MIGHRVQEMQQYLRIPAHRAGDVAQHDQRRRPRLAAIAGDRQDLPALPQAGADGAPQIHHRSGRIRPRRAGAAQIQRQGQAADFLFGVLDLGGAHRLEVHRLQPFLIGDGQRGILDRRLFLGLRFGSVRVGEGLGDAARGRRRFFRLLLLRVEQRHRGGLLGG